MQSNWRFMQKPKQREKCVFALLDLPNSTKLNMMESSVFFAGIYALCQMDNTWSEKSKTRLFIVLGLSGVRKCWLLKCLKPVFDVFAVMFLIMSSLIKPPFSRKRTVGHSASSKFRSQQTQTVSGSAFWMNRLRRVINIQSWAVPRFR